MSSSSYRRRSISPMRGGEHSSSSSKHRRHQYLSSSSSSTSASSYSYNNRDRAAAESSRVSSRESPTTNTSTASHASSRDDRGPLHVPSHSSRSLRSSHSRSRRSPAFGGEHPRDERRSPHSSSRSGRHHHHHSSTSSLVGSSSSRSSRNRSSSKQRRGSSRSPASSGAGAATLHHHNSSSGASASSRTSGRRSRSRSSRSSYYRHRHHHHHHHPSSSSSSHGGGGRAGGPMAHSSRGSGSSSSSSGAGGGGGGSWKTERKKQYRFDSPPRATAETEEEKQKKLLQQQLVGTSGLNVASCLLPSTVAPSVAFSGPASSLALDAAATKAARELYVGNLPPSLEVPQLMEFLNAAMTAVGGALLPGPPAVKAWRSTDGHYAFVEFRTMEEASNGMQLNGLNCMGFNLRIGRPKTYPQELNHLIPPPTIPLLHPQGVISATGAASITALQALQQQTATAGGGSLAGLTAAVASGDPVAAAAAAAALPAATLGLNPSALLGANTGAGVAATAVAPSPQAALAAAQMAAHGVVGSTSARDDRNQQPERLCILNLPPLMSEEKVRQLMETFGPLNAFHLLKKEDGSEMICVVEYLDLESQQQAVEILHSNSPYRVLMAEEAIQQEVIAPFFKKAKTIAAANEKSDEEDAALEGGRLTVQTLLRPQVCSRVLMLANIVQKEELLDDREYAEIVEDIRLECEECGGPVVSVSVPRPVRGFEYESDAAYQKQQQSTSEADFKEKNGVLQQQKDGEGQAKQEQEGKSATTTTTSTSDGDGKADSAEKQEEEEAAEGRQQQKQPPTVGYAYVEFQDCEWSAKARKALNGRKFGGKVVEAHYFSEIRYKNKNFYDPQPNFLRLHSSLYNKSLAYTGPRRAPQSVEEDGNASSLVPSNN